MVEAGSSSTYFYDSTVTSSNLVLIHWDPVMADLSCSDFDFYAPTHNPFIMTNLGTAANFKTKAAPTYAVFDVNSATVDVNSANQKVDMTATALRDLGTSCTADGYRIYVPVVIAQQVKLPTGSLTFPHPSICFYDRVVFANTGA